MEKDWTLVYSVSKSYQAELCLELLAENNITGVVINKKDTFYTSLGEYEIYVPDESAEKARALLQKSEI